MLLEALFFGKPIIISNVGYIEEVLGENYPLYCKAGDVESIVNAIIKFKEEIDLSQLKNFLKIRYERFSLKKHEEELLKIFVE